MSLKDGLVSWLSPDELAKGEYIKPEPIKPISEMTRDETDVKFRYLSAEERATLYEAGEVLKFPFDDASISDAPVVVDAK